MWYYLCIYYNKLISVDTHLPGVVSGIREWFRWYKTPDDKPLNAFGFDEKALPKKNALEVNCIFYLTCSFAYILSF